jgi:hypothetical protein
LGLFVLLAGLALSFPSTASARPLSYIRVIHAAPGVGRVDVYVDGKQLLRNYAFGSITNYMTVSAFSHRIQVTPAGKNLRASVIDRRVFLGEGIPYTIAALGTRFFALQTFSDNNRIQGDRAKIRVYHLSPNLGPINVSVGGTRIISRLTYPFVSDYVNQRTGLSTFRVTATQVGVTTPVEIRLRARTVNSIFAIGLYQGRPRLQYLTATVRAA